jgi:protein gp37
MSETKIPYLTKTWNFHTGCLHFEKGICPIPKDDCWARGNFKRFKWDFTPTLHPEKLLEPLSWKSPQRVGVCFTGDLFGEWVDPNQNTDFAGMQLNQLVSTVMCTRPQHQFFFLTKNPSGYEKWERFPNNAWCGQTLTGVETDFYSRLLLSKKIDARHRWVSFEPLMGTIGFPNRLPTLYLSEILVETGIDWVVIGGWSTQAQRKKHELKIEWIKEIVEACDRAGIPVFLKDNLKPLIEQAGYSKASWAATEWIKCQYPVLRQQLPEAVK